MGEEVVYQLKMENIVDKSRLIAYNQNKVVRNLILGNIRELR